MNHNKKFLHFLADILRRGSAVVILILVAVFFSTNVEQFRTIDNLLVIALQTSLIALVGIGMTFTIITGGIDLSVGSVAAFCGAISAGLATQQQIGTYPAILVGLLIGIGLGAINGAMVVLGRIPPFVATLAMMAVARGLTLVYTQGRPISGLADSFTFWGSDGWLGISLPVYVLFFVAVIAYIILNHTSFGLHVFAVGGNEESARLASVNSRKIKFLVYVISGFCASITGIILTARLWSAQPNAGVGIELDAIASAVLGGASLAGGAGGIGGTITGAFIIGALSNGLNLLEVPSFNQQVVKGLVFILAVLLDYFIKRRSQIVAASK